MSYRALTSSGFGWELPELDPSRALEAFHGSGGFILIRNQQGLTPRELMELAALFGELELNEKYDPDFLLPAYPEILRLGNLRENGKYRSLFTKADPPPLLWHTDDSFRIPQPMGSCLLCVKTPPSGGETGFAGITSNPSEEAEVSELGKLSVFAGVREFPMRVKCATLAWHAMREAIHHSGKTATTE